jgi:hypothetical protein
MAQIAALRFFEAELYNIFMVHLRLAGIMLSRACANHSFALVFPIHESLKASLETAV